MIGAGRSGTTWLYENLSKCDAIWLPPVKELHYFDRSPEYPSPSHLFSENVWKRLTGMENHNKDFRIKMLKGMGKQILRLDPGNFWWCCKYYFGAYSDEWYVSLFKNQRKITGDITPAYQLLGMDAVSHIHDLLPNAKIIFMLRNPVDRTWSQLRKNRQAKYDLTKIREILNSDDVRLRNDYLYTIRNWTRYYPPSQFRLCFFDDIINAPNRLLKELFAFLLGKKCCCQIHDKRNNLKKKINSAPEQDMESEVKKLIVDHAYPNLKRLCGEIGGYSCEWLKSAETFLGQVQQASQASSPSPG